MSHENFLTLPSSFDGFFECGPLSMSGKLSKVCFKTRKNIMQQKMDNFMTAVTLFTHPLALDIAHLSEAPLWYFCHPSAAGCEDPACSIGNMLFCKPHVHNLLQNLVPFPRVKKNDNSTSIITKQQLHGLQNCLYITLQNGWISVILTPNPHCMDYAHTLFHRG